MKKLNKNLFAVFVSVMTALVLTLGKTAVFFFSGSLAVLASALDSFLDMFVSLMNFFVVRAAEKPADRNHGFGHGKFEAFAEWGQGLFLLFSSFFLAFSAIKRFFSPVPIENESVGIVVMILSLVITFFLSLFLKKTAEETGSLVVKADRAHYFSDVLMNAAVIVGLFGAGFLGMPWIDSGVGLVIALVIAKTAVALLRESFEILNDQEMEKEKRDEIVKILNEEKGVRITDWHLLRTRRVGSKIQIDAHLVFSNCIPLWEAHEISENITKKIHEKIPQSSVLFHFDPKDDAEENRKMMEA